jgi:CubicO group peptidase (beta-lactamase class C family)
MSKRFFSRRQVLQGGAIGLAAATVAEFGTRAASAASRHRGPMTGVATTRRAQGTPMTGQTVPELAAFDDAIAALMSKWNLPGGQLAVAKNGRLALNRGYGLADVDREEPVLPESLFRVGSVSKAITAVAIMALIDAGKLALDTKVFPLLDLEGPRGAGYDPRLDRITVEQLLVHSGGWDRDSSTIDPTFLPWSRMAAATMGVDDPPMPPQSFVSCLASRSISIPAANRSTPTSATTCLATSSSASPGSSTATTCRSMS